MSGKAALTLNAGCYAGYLVLAWPIVTTMKANMRYGKTFALLTLAPLSACMLPMSAPQQGVRLDCHHFYRNAAGVWQADGNATAVVNGRQWFLGIEQFTPAGPVVGGQGGELLYNDIQRQCGGGIPVAVATASSSPQQCLADGSKVTLSGRIRYRTVPPDAVDGLPGHHYARMTLDHPVCVLEGGFGAVPHGTTVAVVPEGIARPGLRDGAHVTLSGTLIHQQTLNEPPEALQFNVLR